MKSTKTCLPRPVVMHFFVLPNQRMVRWNYASIKAAKKVWHPTRLVNAAREKLQPWTSGRDWRSTSDKERETGNTDKRYKALYVVRPSTKPVLRYQTGEMVRSSDIRIAVTQKRRRRKKCKSECRSESTTGRRLRYQQILDNDEPGMRPRLRVHPLYYEDAWTVRNDDRNWKHHRKSQWKE